MTHLHAIVLTLNEEKHLARCLESIRDCCATVVVVDSGSTDRTIDIARDFGASVLSNAWINYASQLNFGIRALAGRGGWVLRIDADEILRASASEVRETLALAPAHVDGLLVRRRLHFLGRPMKWGGMDPVWQLRIWREGRGACERRWMDEHMIVQGAVKKSKLLLDDINLNSLGWWIDKHNKYAAREAIDILARKYGMLEIETVQRPQLDQTTVKRFLKERVYLPLGGTRSFLYFLYRYLFRLGFLDGIEGYYFHVLQGLCYRAMVDAKVLEIERYAADRGVPLPDAVEACTGIAPMAAPKD